MPRYRNPKTGVVVDIPAELAESMGVYVPMDSATQKAGKPTEPRDGETPTPTRRKSSTRRKPADD